MFDPYFPYIPEGAIFNAVLFIYPSVKLAFLFVVPEPILAYIS